MRVNDFDESLKSSRGDTFASLNSIASPAARRMCVNGTSTMSEIASAPQNEDAGPIRASIFS
jgi:hypothetical protein